MSKELLWPSQWGSFVEEKQVVTVFVPTTFNFVNVVARMSNTKHPDSANRFPYIFFTFSNVKPENS